MKLDYAVPARPRPIHPVFWAFAAAVVVVLGWSGFVPKLGGGNRSERARATAAHTDAAMLHAALERFESDTGRLPTADEGLGALVYPPAGVDRWRGPYFWRLPLDPWGNPYVYQPVKGTAGEWLVLSIGPDGKQGTADDVLSTP